MAMHGSLTFRKEERVCSRKLIDKLFCGGFSRSLTAFPIRLVYLKTETIEGDPQVKILISVPKKFFKRAVKRNRVKRQLREAYRKNKAILSETIAKHKGMGLVLAFIWIDDKLYPSSEVEKKVVNLLQRMSEKVETL